MPRVLITDNLSPAGLRCLEAAGLEERVGAVTEVLDALEADHDFLLEGDVFTPDLLEEYIKYKRVHEVDAVRLRPTPHEFALYFDC
jgi:glutamine synthetase